MPDVTVEIEVYCSACGEGLCNQTDFVKTRNRSMPAFRVLPCEKCLQNSEDRGYDKGYEQGRKEMEG